MSAPPQESTSHAPPPTTPLGATQTVLSFLGHAAREAPPDPPTVPTVLGAAQNVLSRLASSSTPHATPAPHHLVPDVSREHPAEVFAPPELPPRAAEPTGMRPAPTSISSHGSSGAGHSITPPQGARITRSYPALTEATPPPPRRIRVSQGGVHRRSTGPYIDGETAWHYDDKDPVHSFREKNVAERLKPTIKAAKDEHTEATKQAKLTGWAQNIALGLQIFIGALTTALGAALSGKKTSVAVSILGGASTLVASFLARTKSSNEPQTSLFRAQALDHFLREIEAFTLDHGHEIGDKFDDRIFGFRLGLERILGNQSGNPTFDSGPGPSTNPNPGREKEKWGGGGDSNTGPSGNGKYPVTSKPGLLPV